MRWIAVATYRRKSTASSSRPSTATHAKGRGSALAQRASSVVLPYPAGATTVVNRALAAQSRAIRSAFTTVPGRVNGAASLTSTRSKETSVAAIPTPMLGQGRQQSPAAVPRGGLAMPAFHAIRMRNHPPARLILFGDGDLRRPDDARRGAERPDAPDGAAASAYGGRGSRHGRQPALGGRGTGCAAGPTPASAASRSSGFAATSRRAATRVRRRPPTSRCRCFRRRSSSSRIFNLADGDENAFADRLITHMKLDGATASIVRDLFGTTADNAPGRLGRGRDRLPDLGALDRAALPGRVRARVAHPRGHARPTSCGSRSGSSSSAAAIARHVGSAAELRAGGWLVRASGLDRRLDALLALDAALPAPRQGLASARSCPARSSRRSSSAGRSPPRRSGSGRR